MAKEKERTQSARFSRQCRFHANFLKPKTTLAEKRLSAND